jgi:hypothetical protein
MLDVDAELVGEDRGCPATTGHETCPRYCPIVRAFVGDSTMIRFFNSQAFPWRPLYRSSRGSEPSAGRRAPVSILANG